MFVAFPTLYAVVLYFSRRLSNFEYISIKNTSKIYVKLEIKVLIICDFSVIIIL